MRNLIRRILGLDTTRYFIVFYTFSCNGKYFNGNCSVTNNGKSPFLNPKQINDKLKIINKTDETHVITGFKEVSLKEYKLWNMTDI